MGGFPIPRKHFQPLWVQFRYEKLADFCYSCGFRGHIQKLCRTPPPNGELLGVGPYMRADPATMRKAIFSKGLLATSSLHELSSVSPITSLPDKGKPSFIHDHATPEDGLASSATNVVHRHSAIAMDEDPASPAMSSSSPLKLQVADTGPSIVGSRPANPDMPAGPTFIMGDSPQLKKSLVKPSSSNKNLMPLTHCEDAADVLAELQQQPFILEIDPPTALLECNTKAALEFTSPPLSQLFDTSKKKLGLKSKASSRGALRPPVNSDPRGPPHTARAASYSSPMGLTSAGLQLGSFSRIEASCSGPVQAKGKRKLDFSWEASPCLKKSAASFGPSPVPLPCSHDQNADSLDSSL